MSRIVLNETPANLNRRNGATEVTEWRFYGSDDDSGRRIRSFSLVAAVPRAGFETEFASDGFHTAAYAEAVAEDGTTLGRTATQELKLPEGWTQQGEDSVVDFPSLTNKEDEFVSAKDEL